MAARFNQPGGPWDGLTRKIAVGPSKGPEWTGKIVEAGPHIWDAPLRWRKPRRIFVNSMSDTFHPAVTDAQLDRLFGVMACTQRHCYQVLTKRPARMRDFILGCQRGADEMCRSFPWSNVWLGVTVEDQARAEERIPILQDTPAAVRWLSIEPQLEPIDLRGMLDGVHWVVCGGESGPRARPFHLEWALDIIDVCDQAGVAAYFKQGGANCWWEGKPLRLKDSKGGDLSEFPVGPWPREFPEVTA